MDTPKKSPVVLSLCTGYGGLEDGIRRAVGQITVLAHVEIEAFAVANLVNKMETGSMVPVPVWTDLKTFKSGIFRGHVDILTGGYPCQPFSHAGKRLGEEDPRHLWPYITEIVKDCEPGWVFFENVEGHLTSGIVQVLTDLEEMGYTAKAGIFSAVEVGAPHQRKRVFILANSQRQRTGLHVAHGSSKYGGHKQDRNKNQIPATKSSKDQLDNPNSDGQQRHESRIKTEQNSNGAKNGLPRQTGETQWPARPGEYQYIWEAPRVVGNGNSVYRRTPSKGRFYDAQIGHPSTGQTQPELGRAVDGSIDRVDRLRLLGNGVVPQTAEIAFKALYKDLTGDIL